MLKIEGFIVAWRAGVIFLDTINILQKNMQSFITINYKCVLSMISADNQWDNVRLNPRRADPYQVQCNIDNTLSQKKPDRYD